MERKTNYQFYQLGSSGCKLVFQKDLEKAAEALGRPFPEFHGWQLHDQPGGQLQWEITADIRRNVNNPNSERILFFVKDNSWMGGLARAMQEALARLCHQDKAILPTRFLHFARMTPEGKPAVPRSHPDLDGHVQHLSFMLSKVRKDLDEARMRANAAYLSREEDLHTIAILATERRTLRQSRRTKNATITRLRARIAEQDALIENLESHVEDIEEEGHDLRRENAAFLSDDDDYLEEMDIEAQEDDDEEIVDEEEEDPEELIFEDDEPDVPEVPAAPLLDLNTIALDDDEE